MTEFNPQNLCLFQDLKPPLTCKSIIDARYCIYAPSFFPITLRFNVKILSTHTSEWLGIEFDPLSKLNEILIHNYEDGYQNKSLPSVIRKNFEYEKNYLVEMVTNCLGLYNVIDAFAEIMKKNFKLALHPIALR